MLIDYKKSQEEVLCDLIRRDNPGRIVDTQWFIFSEPEEIDPNPDIPRNTRINTTQTMESDYVGSMFFYYNRLNIVDLRFGDIVRDEDLEVNVNGLLYSDDCYSELSRIFDIRVDRNMLQREVLPVVLEGQPVNYTLRFKPNNKTIVGEIQVRLVR